MTHIDTAVLDLTERLCRWFQAWTGRTNVWLAFQLTNLSIVVYFIWAAGLYVVSGDLTVRIFVALFCGGVFFALTRTLFRVSIDWSEMTAYRRVARGVRNPRRIRDAQLRIAFLTLSVLLAYPLWFVYITQHLRFVLLTEALIILTTVVLYVLACDPLPPCAGKVKDWVRGMARPRAAPVAGRPYAREANIDPIACAGLKPVNALVLPRVAALALALALAATTAAGAQPEPDVEALLMRVGERVAEFYNRAKNVICIETSTVRPVDFTNWPEGFVRTVESELHFEADGGQAPGEAAVVRKVRKVNGRAPREKDDKDRTGCTDPNPVSLEPLAFLLPAHRSEYQFRTAGIAKDRNRAAVVIDFASVDRRSNAELIEDPGGHDDCFDWSGHLASKGRVWVDAVNDDVLRVERGLGGPVDVRVPALLQRRYQFASSIVLEREDVTIRYKTVAFSDPDEVLLLPESIESLTVVRGGLVSTRRNQTFSDYKRFVTAGRVLQ